MNICPTTYTNPCFLRDEEDGIGAAVGFVVYGCLVLVGLAVTAGDDATGLALGVVLGEGVAVLLLDTVGAGVVEFEELAGCADGCADGESVFVGAAVIVGADEIEGA